jgi:hypothetical protein
MSALSTDAAAAQRFVEARLGREPQDMLEAAVVLEAWGGVPASRAIPNGRAVMPSAPAPARPSAGTVPVVRRPRGVVLEGASLVLTVIAIALWAAPLGADLGGAVVEQALRVALPLTLALQWGLRSRYLGRPKGLVELGRRRRQLLLGAVLLVGLPFAAFGVAGLLGGLLTVTWTGGTLLIRRRWIGAYTGIVVGGTGLMMAPIPALAALGAIAALTTLAVGLALRAPAPSPRSQLGRWSRALCGAALGAALGVLLVSDPSAAWTQGMVPALALLPSTVAGFWASYHLWQIESVIPRALLRRPAARSGGRRAALPPLRTLFGALGRLVVLSAALSVALVALTESLDVQPGSAGVLIGFGLLAVVTLLVSLVEALGRGGWALLALCGALAAEAVTGLHGRPPFPGGGLAAGAGMAILVLLPVAIALLSRPARTLATRLWIT